MKFILLIIVPALLSAQDAAERMRASLESQKASVRRQVLGAQEAPAGGFFTVPWPMPASVTPLPSRADSPDCETIPETTLASLISDAARREDLKPDLIRAVIRKESAGRPCAVSPKGAQGLMQLMPDTAKQLLVSDPLNPKQNVDAGAKFLKQLMVKYAGNMSLALGAYNAGSGLVDKVGGVPQNAETQNYVSEILGMLEEKPKVP